MDALLFFLHRHLYSQQLRNPCSIASNMYVWKLAQYQAIVTVIFFLGISNEISASTSSVCPTGNLVRKNDGASYCEAYVVGLSPKTIGFDGKGVLSGLSGIKKMLQSVRTFDSNEYAYFDNPMQICFVKPPTFSQLLLRSKNKEQKNGEDQDFSPRFDFWIPL